jgi:hypothetical protein
MAEQNRLQLAGKEADAIVERLALQAPIDPLAIVRSERPFLRAGGRDLGNRYDGRLEYHRDKNRFLLFFNTKYDLALPPGRHHPRTRFSIGHELGHYFLERHRAYLMRQGRPHPSAGEFRSAVMMEREADSFAASILLPTRLASSLINSAELSLTRLAEIADHFQASLVSTMFRSVLLSDFPCAVAGIRDGAVAWMFPSEPLIQAGIYPGSGALPGNATEPWTEFQQGIAISSESEGRVRDWFQTYDRDDLERVYVTEEYLPVLSMGTLLVLLTLDEADVFNLDDEESDDD